MIKGLYFLGTRLLRLRLYGDDATKATGELLSEDYFHSFQGYERTACTVTKATEDLHVVES
jgi:hypothetical protein